VEIILLCSVIFGLFLMRYGVTLMIEAEIGMNPLQTFKITSFLKNLQIRNSVSEKAEKTLHYF